MNESSQQDARDGAFYLYYDDEQHGPLSSAQVRGLYLDGAVGDDTPACQAGMAEWQPLKTVLPGLTQVAAPPLVQPQTQIPLAQSQLPPHNQQPPPSQWGSFSPNKNLVVALVGLLLLVVVAKLSQFQPSEKPARTPAQPSPTITPQANAAQQIAQQAAEEKKRNS